jgi:hypothetical protein
MPKTMDERKKTFCLFTFLGNRQEIKKYIINIITGTSGGYIKKLSVYSPWYNNKRDR